MLTVTTSSHRFLNYTFAFLSSQRLITVRSGESMKYKILPISFQRPETVGPNDRHSPLSLWPMSLSSSTSCLALRPLILQSEGRKDKVASTLGEAGGGGGMLE